MLEVRCRQSHMQLATVGYRYVAGLLRHHDGKRIGSLGYAERRAVAQTERAGHIAVMAYRQDASGAHDPEIIDNQGTVMEGRDFKEYVLYKAGIDESVYCIAAIRVLVKRHNQPEH